MAAKSGTRAVLTGLVLAGSLLLQACAPIPRVIDTPKDGAQVSLDLEQPMQVRWSNMSPEHGAWALEGEPAKTVTLVGHTAQPAEGGALALDVFDFVGAHRGVEQLTFVYKRKDGTPPRADERVTIELAVG